MIETVMTYDQWEVIHNRKMEIKRARIKKKAVQKLMGIATLVFSVLIPIVLDGDATACLLTVPLGLALLFSKDIIIY